MELTRLITALSDPAAYPDAGEAVEVRQTHISAVFLTKRHAYKVKKPANLGFLNFTTIEKRRHFCEEEVRLNRRLAPSVYLDVVPITEEAEGALKVEGAGEAVEWAVKMERLPEEASLLSRLERGELTPALLEALAARVAEFHSRADGGPHVAAFGRFHVVADNAWENFAQSVAHVGVTLTQRVFDRLRSLTQDALARLWQLMESRSERGMPRDTHGDLRLDHVYHFPDRPPPDDLVAIDCIEFNERFRFADPVADAAFLCMDLAFRGRRDLADAFAAAYFRAADDADGARLLPFYVAYRSAVRAKVRGFQLDETEIPEEERIASRERARAHWLLALGELEEPARRPCLVLVAGLPGSGKSTLARCLAECAGFTVIRSDVVRKELAGLPPDAPARGAADEGIYAPEWTEWTYAECLRRAEALLCDGGRVVVDANFGDEGRRRAFLDAAARLAVPALILLCRASEEATRTRLEARRGDASDADFGIYERAAARWQALGRRTRAAACEIGTDGSAAETLAKATEALKGRRLAG
jgi:aminoglycoside phosphotransferase family enzyme/predicted kinase